MLECGNCNTLNPNAEIACLACGSPLAATAATGLASGRCPAGHPVDPTWKTCPYCERRPANRTTSQMSTPALDAPARSAVKTRLEPQASAAAAGAARTRLHGVDEKPAPQAEVPGVRQTRLEEPEPPRGRRTVLEGSGESPSSPNGELAAGVPAAPTDTRPLVAALAAPGLGPGGTVFPVRTGRNSLGSGSESDVVLAADPEVSREHAVILHRGDTFHLADRLSTNGTWVNGREIPANGTVPLADRDLIRLGRTELVFLRIDVAPTSD